MKSLISQMPELASIPRSMRVFVSLIFLSFILVTLTFEMGLVFLIRAVFDLGFFFFSFLFFLRIIHLIGGEKFLFFSSNRLAMVHFSSISLSYDYLGASLFSF